MIRTYDLSPSGDGVEHINIYSRGTTKLGVMLSNFHHSPFVLEGHGRFESVEGFWYWWLKGRDEKLRDMYGVAAKKYGQSIPIKYTVSVVDRDVIKEAIFCKIDQNEEIKSLLRDSTLPFEHYYWNQKEDGSIAVLDNPQHRWQVDWIEQIREWLKKQQ